MSGPRRRVQITLALGADSWEDAAHALEQMALEIRMGHLRGESVSGGYSTGYVYFASEEEAVTHDSWYEELQAYLQAPNDNADRTPENT